MHDKRIVPQLLVMVIAAVAFTAVLWMTRWGVGTSPDSVAYISTARNLWSGLAAAGDTALVFRPPFYPFLLAVIGLAGLDPLVGARWLNALLFAGNVLLVGLVVWRCQPQTPWLAPLGALLALLALPLLEIHAYAWTEPAFICLGFVGLYGLSLFLVNEQKRWLWFTAVLFALAWLTRYAGLAFMLTGGLGLLLFSGKRWPHRVGDALVLGVIGSMPLALWVGRNLGQGSSATGRSFVFHPVNRTHFWQAVFTLSDWLHMPAATPGLLRVLVLAALGMTAVAVLFFSFPRSRRDAPHLLRLPFYRLLLLFLPTYLLFLLFSISFLDAATPLDGRILSPVYIASLCLGMGVLAELHGLIRRWRLVQAAVAGVLLLFLVVALGTSGGWAYTAYGRGLGFSSAAWQQAEISTHLRALPDGTLIFSNSPDAVYLLTNRPAQPLPKKVEATTQMANEHYAADLAAMGNRLRLEDGVVVYFLRVGQRAAVPGPQELVQSLLLHPIVETAEGSIYAPETER